ncbi:MAG TPA: tyrosinase family protein, partial [Sphingomicrobium sp.]|nr:tyrosinase family protein [Sphingomicrobium sp.]
ALLRQFATIMPTLPTAEDVKLAMDEVLYDTPPFSSSPFVVGFRNRIEGWVTQRGDPRVKTPGSQLHNRVHLWVGGSMVPMTSPNDPVFFLHHCFIDKIWADWQAANEALWREQGYPGTAPQYNPVSGGPVGHNLDDRLTPWTRTISEVLSSSALGYHYEAAVNESLFAVTRRISPFAVERSPFWAD